MFIRAIDLPPEDRKVLGARIKALRVELGFSLKDLAWKIGLNTIQLHKIENGAENPAVETIYELSKIYNRSAHFILFGKERTVTPKYEPGHEEMWTTKKDDFALLDTGEGRYLIIDIKKGIVHCYNDDEVKAYVVQMMLQNGAKIIKEMPSRNRPET